MAEFYTVVTDKGLDAIRNCIENNIAFAPKKMAIGDSDGAYYEPETTQTALKNQLYINDIATKGKKGNYLFFNFQVPPSEGDYTIREVGLFDEESNLLAVAKYPETLKSKANDTNEKSLIIELQIQLTNRSINTIILDDCDNFANINLSNISDEAVKKINEIVENNIVDKADKATTYTQNEVDTLLETRADVDLSNLSETGEKHFLNKSQIANCLLEVPQRIKYSFDYTTGVLTIKAGSIVSYPNGAGVFKDITLEKDLSISSVGSGSDDIFIIYRVTSNSLTFGSVSTAIVGTTVPTSTAFYYDTTNNKISFYSEGTLHSTNYAFPLLIASRKSGVLTSVNQIFNGVGWIGNINFLLPKTKMLIAHGYNDDGTYNNVEYVNDTVIVSKNYFVNNTIMFFRKYVNGTLQIYNINSSNYLGELNYIPEVGSTFQWYYNTLERLWYMHEVNETVWKQVDYFNIAKCTATSVEPIEPFRAVDYSDFAELKDNSANTSLTNLTSGLSNAICTTAPTVKSYGVTLIGGATLVDNILATFSTANYALINGKFSPASYTWEMNFIIGIGTDVTTLQEILSDANGGIEIGIRNSHFKLEINQGSIIEGTYTVLANTTYWVRVQFTGTEYALYYSLDGKTYTKDVTVTSSTPYNGSYLLYLGKDINNNSEPFLGAMNVAGMYIVVNKKLLWQGVAPTNNGYPTKQKPAVVVDSYVNGVFWCRVWSDGWIEQGGEYTSTSDNLLQPFIKPFSTANVTFTSQFQGDNAELGCTGSSSYVSQTHFRIWNAMHGGSHGNRYGTNHWYACGY